MKSLFLKDLAADAWAEILPERGALVRRFEVGGEPLLSMDEATLTDPTKNVRGGIPVLFPIAGKLPDDTYAVDGRPYVLKQHGFARTLPWQALRHSEADPAELELRLESDAQTLAQFPWRFEARLTFVLHGGALSLLWKIRNDSSTPMPLHLGYHPYFVVPDAEKEDADVQTDASRAWDNKAGKLVPHDRFELTLGEVDLHLLDHTRLGTTLVRGARRPIELYWDPEFRILVIWTLAGKDFVCVEPWTAPGGALAKGDELPWVAPGEEKSLKFQISLGKKA